MKYYIILMYIFLCTGIYGQTKDTVISDRPIIFVPADSVYIIPKEKAETIDMWARRGIECRKSIEESEILLNELKEHKLISDSISVMFRNNLLKTKEELTKIEENNILLVKDYNTLNKKFTEYKEQNKACKSRNITDAIGYISIGSSLIAIAIAVILTN